MFRTVFLVAMLTWSLASMAAGSGTGCQSEQPSITEYIQAIRLADKTIKRLEQRYKEANHNVVLIARIGSDTPQKRFTRQLSPYWYYTHAGIAIRNQQDGTWQVVHLLNTCNEASSIFAQGLIRFSLDKPFKYRNLIIEIDNKLQKSLTDIVRVDKLATAFHADSSYSSIASPFSLDYQNSNEYILAILSAAMAKPDRTIVNREQAKQYFLTHLRPYFVAEGAKIGFFEALGSSFGLGPGNATLKDHSKNEKRKGEFLFVSVGSVFQMLSTLNRLEGAYEVE